LPGDRADHHPRALRRRPLPEPGAIGRRAGGWPDLELFPILLPLAAPGLRPPDSGYALSVSVVAPDSVGSVALASADPAAAPLIDPGFLRDHRDVDRFEAGLDLIRRAAATDALARLGTEIHPGPDGKPATGCATISGAGSAATTTRPAAAASATTVTTERSSTRSCGCAASTAFGWPTRRCCR
jgi:choline dehydrogenase-like flavoprotein